MIHEKTIRKIEKSLFRGKKAPVRMSEKELEIRDRYMALFHLMMERPEQKDIHRVSFLQDTYGISQTQAFTDVRNMKVIFGNFQKSAKEWDRYVVTEMLKDAYEKAEKVKDIKNMVYAADKLGKYTKLDQEEGRDIPYDEIVPLDIEPTGDVSVLGLKPVEDLAQRQRALRAKYGKIEDAEIIDDE